MVQLRYLNLGQVRLRGEHAHVRAGKHRSASGDAEGNTANTIGLLPENKEFRI
jgi:hypothetical protein